MANRAGRPAGPRGARSRRQRRPKADGGRRLNIRIVDRYARRACGAAVADAVMVFDAATDGDPVAIARAKQICAGCPIRELCLRDALEAERGRGKQYRWGVLGGLDRDERYELAPQPPKDAPAVKTGDAA